MTSIRSFIGSIPVQYSCPGWLAIHKQETAQHHVRTIIRCTGTGFRPEAEETTYAPQTGRTAEFQLVARRERRSESSKGKIDVLLMSC